MKDKLLALAAVLAMVFAIFAAHLIAGTDRIQGVPQRIFYIHVPSAWVAFLAFFLVFLFSLLYLWKGERKFDIWAHASAEVGVVFCTVVLLTGPIWARPIWGVWWTWDARLTTTLVLWLIYVGYLMLRAYIPDPERRARYAAVVGIVGFLDVPLVYVSVVWWRTLHPGPTVLRSGGLSDLPGSMHVALWSTLLAVLLLFFFLLRQRAALEEERDQVAALKARLGE